MSSIFLLMLFPGDVYITEQDFGTALRYYEAQALIEPTYENNYYAGVCALMCGELDRSRILLEGIPQKKYAVNYYLGVVYYQLGQFKLSAEYFLSLGEEQKQIWQANYYLGLIQLKKNDVEKAMYYFRQTPDSVDIVLLVEYVDNFNELMKARDDFVKHDYERSINHYRDVKYFFGFRELGLALAFEKVAYYDSSLVLLDSVIEFSDNNALVAQALLASAKIYLIRKDHSAARRNLRQYLVIEPDDQARFLLALTFSNELKYDSALHYLKELPDSIDRYLFYKGRTEYFLGRWGRAEELLLRHREDFPNSQFGERATFILASINFKRKEYDYAIEFWQELVTLYPRSIYAASAQKSIGDTYFDIQEYSKAINAYRLVKEYNPSPDIAAQTSLRIYESFFYLGKYQSLIDALQSFVDEHPESILKLSTRLRIAKILFTNKEYYRSLSTLNDIIDQDPDSSMAHNAMIEKARVYKTIGNIREVKAVFIQLINDLSAAEYHSYAADELGVLYLEEAKYDSALYYYNMLLSYDKYREKAIFKIAQIYDILGQGNESETMINKLIKDFPNSVFLFDAYIIKSKAFRRAGYYEQAIEVLEELVKKVGDKPEIYIELGNIYLEIEDYLDARKFFLLACEYFRQKRDDAAKALLLAGDASVGLGDHEAAREYYLQANLIAESLSLKNQATAKISSMGEE